jgi:hypothetical protein
VSQATAATHVIDVQGERVSVQEYFKRKYTQKLELLHLLFLKTKLNIFKDFPMHR